jgi:hypothetical protein
MAATVAADVVVPVRDPAVAVPAVEG